MGQDALPDHRTALTREEKNDLACDWADYRSDYGVPEEGIAMAHKLFSAGWKARRDAEVLK